MATIKIEGHTLGQRQRHYNYLIREMCKNNTAEIKPIDYAEPDVENLMKIDIACHRRDVDYILDVFKCDDMLYVTRAIKQSTWMITEDQYAHIINADYLSQNLFPHMLKKAINKLLLHIKVHLRDEPRVEQFFRYVYDLDNTKSFEWLLHCSESYMNHILDHLIYKVSLKTLKRLCKRSFSVVQIMLNMMDPKSMTQWYLPQMLFILKMYPEEYLNAIEALDNNQRPGFIGEAARILMEKFSERVFEQYHLYHDRIESEIINKYVKVENIQHYVQTNMEYSKYWLCFENLAPILDIMTKENTYDLLKRVYSFKDDKLKNKDLYSSLFNHILAVETEEHSWQSEATVHRWYQYAPFDIALLDLAKHIYAESSPEKRQKTLSILLKCARQNTGHIRQVIQYYREKHINEPFKYNLIFVHNVISLTETQRFDKETWNALNEIFHKMEVYVKSDNKVKTCIEAIIVYKIISDEIIPRIVEEKFEFQTMKEYRSKLIREEKERLFTYLFNYLAIRINENPKTESEFQTTLSLIQKLWELLQDWQKERLYYVVIDKINQLLKINKQNGWKINMSELYIMLKSHRKYFFEKSLILQPCQEVCINILKHDPGLIDYYRNEVADICRDDKVSLNKFLSKLRIYWPETFLQQWTNSYLQSIKSMTGHKVLVRGLYTLLPRDNLLEFIEMHAPDEAKINWSDDEVVELSLRKHIAKNMHLSRPLLPSKTALLYAKGDYLQFALLSLNGIHSLVKSTNMNEHIRVLLSAPVSLQKHGIRLALAKLKTGDVVTLFSNIWKSTRNCTARAELFSSIRDLVCKEKDPSLQQQAWELLKTFIDDLHDAENKIVYQKLAYLADIPSQFFTEYYSKCYICLRSLPIKTNCKEMLEEVLGEAINKMHVLDHDFVGNVLLQPVDCIYKDTDKKVFLKIMSAYIMCSDSKHIQKDKYDKLVASVIENSMPLWASGQELNIMNNFKELLYYLCCDVDEYEYKVSPLNMFTTIQKDLEKHLPMRQYYTFLTSWKLSVAYVARKRNHIPSFDQMCLEYLSSDAKLYNRSIFAMFSEALKNTFSTFSMRDGYIISLLNTLIAREDDVESYLVAIRLLPRCCYNDDSIKYLRRKTLKKLYSHPSLEVKMHYFQHHTEYF